MHGTRLLSWSCGGLCAAAVALALGLSAQSARAQFFDWDGETFYSPSKPTTSLPDPNYIPAPTLEDSNIVNVTAFLQARKNLGLPLAVKIRSPLGPQSVALFSQLHVDYVFADFENVWNGQSVLTQTQTLVWQLNGSLYSKTTGASATRVGNYDYSPITTPDPTRGDGMRHGLSDFRASGVNMATESLYPGDTTFKSPAAGNSTAPNIRSALFTLPVTRLSLVAANMGSGLHIPFISRFDNASNPNLYTKGDGKAFVPGHPLNNGLPNSGATATANQMLSRIDFQALSLHYRMRGASGFHLLDSGVVGYTQAEFESDALAGWNNSTIGDILSGTNGRGATLATSVNVDGQVKSLESAGVVWSAVTNDNPTGAALAILVSNLDNVLHTINLNTRINGATLNVAVDVDAGQHSIVTFARQGVLWQKLLQVDPFAGSSAAMADRNGIGIPEPASVSLLLVVGAGILVRRRPKY